MLQANAVGESSTGMRAWASRTKRRSILRIRPGGAPKHSFFDQVELVVLDGDGDFPTFVQIAEEDALRQRLLQHLLDEPRHGPRPELRRESMVGEPLARVRPQLQFDVLLTELGAQLVDLLIDDALDDLHRQAGEGDPPPEAGAE